MTTTVRQSPYGHRGAITSLWRCRDREVLIDGPAGTGKTRGVLEKVYLAAMKYPRMRALLVRKTRKSLNESVLVTLEDHVLPVGSPARLGPSRAHRQAYTLPNGSTIVLGGMDNAERIAEVMSTEYDLIACFEATELTEDDIEKLTTRLRNGVMPYQQLICDCNPGAPSHHLKARADRGDMTRFPSRHEDNPRLHDGAEWTAEGKQYLGTLSKLTGHRRERLLRGLWVAAEGVVYEEFDERIHVIDPFEPPKDWRRLMSIDFGYTNPFVCQWWAIDHDGRMYLYREIYHSRRLVEDHARAIVAYGTQDGRTLRGTDHPIWCGNSDAVSDHDAEDRATLDRHGVSTIPAIKDITPGIQAVKARLAVQGDGKPRLFIMRGCTVERDEELAAKHLPTATVQEFEAYSWAKTPEGKPNKEEPLDKDNHGMDALRYAVMYEDGGFGASVGVVMGTADVPPPYDADESARLRRQYVDDFVMGRDLV